MIEIIPVLTRTVLVNGDNVSKRFAIKTIDAQRAQLLWAIAQIAAIWTVSDAGYYFLLPALGVTPNYNAGSVAVTLYYGFWLGIAVITFWPLYRSWPQYGRWATFENRLTSYIVWSLSFAGCIIFFRHTYCPYCRQYIGPNPGTRLT